MAEKQILDIPWIKAIMDWVRANRSNDELIFQQAILSENDAIMMIAHVGFEAGRKYQHDNPDAELGPIVWECIKVI